MTETASPAAADAITPANILAPASVPVPEQLNNPAAPPAAAETPPKEAEVPGNQDAAPEKPDDPKKVSARERINQLTAQRREAERRAEAAIAEANRLRAQLTAKSELDPNDFAAQDEDRLRRVVKTERFEETVSEARRAQEQASESRRAVFDAKLDAARDRITDLDQAIGEFLRLPLSEVAADLITESDKSAEIAYFLAKNPGDAERIAALPPHKQGAEIARIEARVSVATPRRTTAAPPPVPMVGASTAPSVPALADMGVEDIAKQIYGRA
jgi:hypothetical protein